MEMLFRTFEANSEASSILHASISEFGSSDEESGCNALTMLAEYCALEPPYEPYIAHPLVPIQTSILDVLAGALERASTKGTANKNRLMECGVGHCFAGALRASTALVRSGHADATSHLHLPHTYPEAVQARRRLWNAILSCGHAQIVSQVRISFLVYAALSRLNCCLSSQGY